MFKHKSLSKVVPLAPHGSGTTATRRKASTAVAMEFDMWVLPAFEFLRLSELTPHEKLRAEGKLVQWDPSHSIVFYVSHQWTSASHPDYSTAQFRAFQMLVLRMVSGQLPETAPTFLDAVRLPSNVKIGSIEWQTKVKDAFIWMDYLSIPQSSQGTAQRDREKATRSIAAYIERCSHFFALCPSVQSRDNEDIKYDYGSWLESGDCRLELFALLLARHHRVPAIVSTWWGRRAKICLLAPHTVSHLTCWTCLLIVSHDSSGTPRRW